MIVTSKGFTMYFNLLFSVTRCSLNLDDKKKHSSLMSLLCLLLSSSLFASNEQDLTDDDFYSDIPTVLTISRLEQPKSEAPSSVTIIDREMIIASGAREIADVFRLVPGFIVGRYTGNKPVITYHGMGYDFNRQLQVLIDGRSVFIPSFGGIPWESLPVILEDIEKIEITRGPNAASYGSNSYLAAINIITTEAFQNSGTQFSVTHSNSDKNIDDAYFRHSLQKDDYDFGISLKSLKDNGIQTFNANNPNHDGQVVNKINLRSNFLIKENSQWSFQFGQSSATFEKGDGDALRHFRDEKAVNRYISLGHEYSSQNTSTLFKLFHTEHNADDSFESSYTLNGITTPATIGFDRYSERSELEIQTTIDQSKNLRLVFGGSIRKDTVDSLFLLGVNQKQSIDVKRLFTHSEYKISNDSIINIGGMLEKSDIADSEFSPRLSFINHIDNQHTLRLAYSQAFRNPILFELFGRWAFEVHHPLLSSISPLEFNEPNPDLEPEEIHSFEISLNSILTPQLETDLKLYHYNISNQIVLDRSSAKPKFNNTDEETKAKGIELSLSFKPSHHFFLKAGLNLINTDGINNKYDESFPDKTAFILSQFTINKRHSISGMYNYLSSFSWLDTDNTIGSTQKLDLRYAYHFTVNNHTPFTLEVIGQNLLSDYEDYFDTNIQSKSYFVKLSSHF